MSRFAALVLTAVASASVQGCTSGQAEIIEPGAEDLAPQSSEVGQPGCPNGAERVEVVARETHCRLSGMVSQDVTLSVGRVYQLAGQVEIASGARLTIEPGVRIYAAGANAALRVVDGAVIDAAGSSAAPIVFTSAYDLGYDAALGLAQRAHPGAPRGEWRGLEIEGATGALRDVHIRFAGAMVSDAEGLRRSPALTLSHVGAETQIQSVTIYSAQGDGVRLVGGAAALMDIAVLGAGDDGVEWSDGFSGSIERLTVAHDARLGDADAGIEASGGAGASLPTVRDVAIVGDAAVSDVGVRLKAGASARFEEVSILGGFASAGFDLDGAETYAQVAPEEWRRVRIAAGDFPALSKDFDDAPLAALFGRGEGNLISADDRSVGDLLARGTVGGDEPAPSRPELVLASAPGATPVAQEAAPQARLPVERSLTDAPVAHLLEVSAPGDLIMNEDAFAPLTLAGAQWAPERS